jgi:hypothetical protein
LNPPTNVYIRQRKNSKEAGKQSVARNSGNLWQYEPSIDDVTGLIVGGEYITQTTLSGVVVGKSISHHHRHSAWQKTELQWVYGDTGMMVRDCATVVFSNQGWQRWTK